MKVVSVLQAQSMRVARILGYPPHPHDLMMALQEKYGFMGLPTPEDVLSGEPLRPMTFKLGKYSSSRGEVVIELLQIYRAASP
jgi:hypothetical protein